jgi:glycolate oxidase
LQYAADPASAPLSSIGGNIMTNAGGPHCLKYGVTFHQVKQIDCVLIGGDALRLDAADAGPDLLGVVIGSEGTLAVVVEATVRLRPLPPATRTLLATFADADRAAEAVFAILATGVTPAALEYADAAAIRMFDHYAPSGYPSDAGALLLIDLDGNAEAVAADLAVVEAELRRMAREVRRADDDAARAALWRGRLHAAQAIVATGLQHCLGDATVPPSRIPALQRAIATIAARHRLEIPTLGHAGDGNLHPVILFDGNDPRQIAAAARAEEELIGAALELGGTITGEHGVGSDKRHSMARHFRPAELAAMRAVKAAFDPLGLLNPGIVLPEAASEEPNLPQFAAAVREAVAARRGAWGERASIATTPASAEPATIAIDRDNRIVTASAATSLRALHAALATHGLRSPLPDGPESVGEMLSSDAAAREVARDALLGVRATLPDGPLVRFGGGLLKDVAGYDLKRLYAGGGTHFGILQEATFQAYAPRGQ